MLCNVLDTFALAERANGLKDLLALADLHLWKSRRFSAEFT